jgi:arsenite-transporting ATPase
MLLVPAQALLRNVTRHVFFTGKGGVGKTSLACAVAVGLADTGRRVLLVSTDPASNLDEVLGVSLGPHPTPVPSAPGLSALNLDPEAAAREYRERIVGPYREALPEAALASIEEQFSGACTMEIAAFDEFSKLLSDPDATRAFDHVVFDTAPTGHTLRLLALPTAWSTFLTTSAGGASCLGPLAGLEAQRTLYDATRRTLGDASSTTLIVVARPEATALAEAERTRGELTGLGLANQRLVLNATFEAGDAADPVARALEARARAATAAMPPGLAGLPRTEVPLHPFGVVGVEALRAMLDGRHGPMLHEVGDAGHDPFALPPPLAALLPELLAAGRGVVMTMGKGGVGKTTVAAALAADLARRGHRVHLTTTDPAAHVIEALPEALPGLRVSRIDPAAETHAYVEEVLGTVGRDLEPGARTLLEEDLRSPCTEEIAVFRAFARIMEEGEEGFVVLDTAPTGHTLLLLDAAEAYHREVSRSLVEVPDAVRRLLPRLRDPGFTKVLIVTLPEATPVHEAVRLQRDLERAGITPFAWIVNQSLGPLTLRDPVLVARRRNEWPYIEEVRAKHASRVALVPWLSERPVGADALRRMVATGS